MLKSLERFILVAMSLLMPLLFVSSAHADDCVNEPIRSQQGSTFLPDCRAFELVTPSDSNGMSVEGLSEFKFQASGGLFPTELVSPSGNGVAFMTFNGPLGEPPATGTLDVAGAERAAGGWKIARRFSPGGGNAVAPIPGGISSDHLYAFSNVSPVFKPGVGATLPGGALAAEGEGEYLGNPDGSFELVGLGSVGGEAVSERLAQGRYLSVGGQHVIFSTGRLQSGSFRCFEAGLSCPVHRLAFNAPPEGTGAVYDRRADGPTEVVSLLPGDIPQGPGQDAAFQGVSKDGGTVAFKMGETLYVRVPDEEDGETLPVAGGNPIFAGLSDDGRYLFYVAGGEDGTIHRFNTSDSLDTEVNPTAAGEVVNVSADGSHVYFISEAEIGSQGTSGKPNLYAWREGRPPLYIATVAASDLEKTSNFGTSESLGFTEHIPALTNWTDWAVTPKKENEQGPGADSSRTNPSGSVLVFESRAKLTSYNNAGHTEIYRWDDEAQTLVCVSCSTLSVSASGDARLQLLTLLRPVNVIHNVSSDGGRVFFETPEQLISEDVDGENDVYEWQANGGGGFSLSLISSGHSSPEVPPLALEPFSQAKPNVIFGITPGGSDVVFLSEDQLVSEAGSDDTPALYDARANGGFSLAAPPSPCSEDGCHPSGPLAPSLEEPRSQNSHGSGNVKPRKRRCAHASKRRKRHRRCARHKGKTGKRRRQGAAASMVGSNQITTGQEAIGSDGNASNTPTAAQSTQSTVSSAGSGEFSEFGIESTAAALTTSAAGSHPELTTHLVLNHFVQNGIAGSSGRTENISVELPSGLVGNPNAVSICAIREFLAFANCPYNSQVGIVKVYAYGFTSEFTEPLYNLALPHPESEVARLGFYAGTFPVFIDVKVRTASDYGIVASVHQGPGQTSLIAATTTLWGSPADPSHDKERLTAFEAFHCAGTACEAPGEKRELGVPPDERKAFVSNPSACQEGSIGFAVTSYQLPGQVFEANTPLASISDCSGLPFSPELTAETTSHVAGAATGLRTHLTLPQHLGAEERATATMREARVTLPEGMQIAAGAANWIGTCSDRQVGFHEEVDAACPDSSKLGTVTIKSPALSAPLDGNVYQRAPSPGHQFGLWLVSDALGMHVKIPGELQLDPGSGRLAAVFSDLPQVPVEEIDLDIWGGERAPLQNPDHCGTYLTDFSFSSHSENPAVSGQSQLTIDQGCSQSFDPKLDAGVTNPKAGKFSPLIVDLAKGDGQQNLRGFEVELPDGELAKLKGVPLCPDASAASGTCPDASAIGHLNAAAGPGVEPLWVPQLGRPTPQVYLAGPYEASPFSIVTVVPAQAGPFDLGNVVVRSGLGLDPETNRAVVKADPLPQFFEGVGLTYRRLHAVIDRPGFSLNPTDCRRMQVDSTVISTQGAIAHPASSFQIDGCKRLEFKPKVTLKLRGRTQRADYPALTATLKAWPGNANIAKASVVLPHSEFLAQEHIGTICTRKQFAAHECPRGSMYGKAKAWTPLLAKPLEGPVYLRSSENPLPDLIAALGGELHVNLVGRIDSKNGGIRTTFKSVPDAPVTKFVLKMKGGAKSLLTNSVDICRYTHRAAVKLAAQNGRMLTYKPVLQSNGCRGNH